MNPGHITLNSEQIAFIAVGICRTMHASTHTGVAFRHSDGDVRFFHQAWHHQTRSEPIAGSGGSDGGRQPARA